MSREHAVKFKIGDRVRVQAPADFRGMVGTVASCHASGMFEFGYTVRTAKFGLLGFDEDELEIVHPARDLSPDKGYRVDAGPSTL